MNRRLRDLVVAVRAAIFLFLAGYGIEIAVDVWVVNHPAPNDPFAHFMPVPVTYIRHYVLPMGGLALFATLLLFRALPAGRDALWTIKAGGTIAEAFGHVVRALTWTMAAIAVFQTAVWLQCWLFGSFLS